MLIGLGRSAGLIQEFTGCYSADPMHAICWVSSFEIRVKTASLHTVSLGYYWKYQPGPHRIEFNFFEPISRLSWG